MKKSIHKFLYLGLLLFLLIPVIVSPKNEISKATIETVPKNSSSIMRLSVLNSGHVYWHHNDGYVRQQSGTNRTMVGHDFDYWDESWRGWYSFNTASLQQTDQILSVQVKFRIIGKPEESNQAKAQLGFYSISTDPLLKTNHENVFKELGSGVQFRNGTYFSIDDNTQFPSETDYIDLGPIGAKSLELSIPTLFWGFSVIDQYEGIDTSDYDEGLILELADIRIEYIPNGKIIRVIEPLGTLDISNQQTHEIRWKNSTNIQNISILLYKNGIFERKIESNIADREEYAWEISSLETKAFYTLAIVDSTNTSIMGLTGVFILQNDNINPSSPDFDSTYVIIFIIIMALIFVAIFFSSLYRQQKPPVKAYLPKSQDFKPESKQLSQINKIEEKKAMIICQNCGVEVEKGSEICKFCGERLD